MILKVEDNKEILKNMRMMVKVLGKNVEGLKLSKERMKKILGKLKVKSKKKRMKI